MQAQAFDKQRRNALSLACSSPPEVLQHVFDIYVNDENSRWPGYQDPEDQYPPTVLLSHVCTRWRALCLNDKHLWANVTLSHHHGRWPLVFVSRSGNCPMEIAFRFSEKYGPEMAQAVVDNMHRVRSLDTKGTSKQLQLALNALTQTAAPILERLYLGHDLEPDMHHMTVYTPSNIFAGMAPKLHYLCLGKVIQHHPVHAFANLRTVYSNYALTAETARPFFRSTPDLQAIIFFHLSAHADANARLPEVPSSDESKRVDVNQLTCLAIEEGDAAKIAQLLDSVNAPSLSQISLSGIYLNESSIDRFATTLPSALSFHIRTLRQIYGPCRVLVVKTLAISCWPRQNNLVRHDLIDDDDFMLPFDIHWFHEDDNSPEDDEPFVNGILSVLPVDEVHTLHLWDMRWNWESLYRASNVTKLIFVFHDTYLDADVRCFLQAMIPPGQRLDVPDVPLDNRILFPKLSTIVFCGMRIHPETPDSEAFVRILERLSQARQTDGISLEVDFKSYHDQGDILYGL